MEIDCKVKEEKRAIQMWTRKGLIEKNEVWSNINANVMNGHTVMSFLSLWLCLKGNFLNGIFPYKDKNF